jgi:hypothetical protein
MNFSTWSERGQLLIASTIHTSEKEEPDSEHEKEKIQTNDVDVSSKMMRREEGTPAASLLCRSKDHSPFQYS